MARGEWAVVGERAGADTSTLGTIGGLNSQINGTYAYLTLDASGTRSITAPHAAAAPAQWMSSPTPCPMPTATTAPPPSHGGAQQLPEIQPRHDVTVFEKDLDRHQPDGQALTAGTVVGSQAREDRQTCPSGTVVGSVSGRRRRDH